MGYYYGRPAPFATGYGVGLTDENITRFNEAIFAACTARGRLAQMGTVTCMETDSLLANMGSAHVVTELTQAELNAILVEPLAAPDVGYFNVFWRDNPGGLVIGDGMHLSEAGKHVLIEALYRLMLEIDSEPAPPHPASHPIDLQ
jgi:hypothetical protein